KDTGVIDSAISNSSTGAIKIVNDNVLGGSITNTGDASTSAANNIDITNNKNLTGTVINNGKGSIHVQNTKGTGSITGNINNGGSGSITLDNEGNSSSNQINNNGTGSITINNKDTGVIDSNISNSASGAIKIVNDNVLGGTITNTGDASTSAANNIDITNNKNLTGTVTNNGKGSIHVQNTKGTGSITGNINNGGSGSITLDNEGNSSSNKINNTDTGLITINNKDTGVIDSAISNSSTGAIKIVNDNVLGGTITNTGDASTSAANNIDITNNKNLTGTVTNNGKGSIHVQNTKGTGSITGNINNGGSGSITLDNEGNSSSNQINNNGTGSITINNKDTGVIDSNISNSASGAIKIVNNNVLGGTITNTGDASTSAANNIDITNNKNLTGTVTNNGKGSIHVQNTKGTGSITGNINNGNSGSITLDNEGNSSSNQINNNGTGSITINNKDTGVIDSAISNSSTGAIKIVNNNILSGSITNTGAKGLSDTNNINIINNRKITGNITNQGTGSIEVTNSTDGELDGDISNESSGMISLINNGNIDNNATGVSSSTGKINNLNNGTLKITNNNTMSRAFDNNGTGTLIVENNGQMNGNKITNNDEGTIEIHNNLKGHLDSEITNNKKGNIQITNDDVLGGLIANLGERKGSDENNIEIINRKTLTSTVRNDASGAIKITNESSGNLSSNIINNRSGKISFINQGVSSPAQITNSGTGEVSVINNHILRTDVTNDETSSGLISFSNTADFDGNLVNANTGSIIGVNTGNFTGTTSNSGFTKNGKIDLDNQGIWTNTGNSVLTNLTNSKGTIKFPEIPSVDAADKDKYHSITVKGDYTGGGQMYVNTFWNKDGTTYSDRVDIAGNVIGNKPTTVHTANKNGIYGDVTQKEIPIHSAVVVHVDGQTTGSDFTGKAPTTNAGEAQLEKINTTRADGSAGTDYAWTLKAKGKTGPDKPNPPEVPIYAEPVSGYVQMPTADMELGFTTIGTLHERRSENQTYNINGTNNTALGEDQQQTWARVVVKHLDKDGKKRLDTAGNQSVLQIGHDFILDENDKNGTRRHVGGYVAYGHNENDFRDQYRAENGRVVDDHYNGKGRTDAVSVGGYGTFYGINGGYVDLVGQVTYLRNKYSARSNESEHQNGWGAALSAETGKSFIVYGNNWFIEPQAQLVYQYLSLDDFNDRIRHVDQHDPSALRGRVGMRFGYNGDVTDNLPPSSFYGVANIWHDFVNPKSVDIGRDSLKEEYAKTWGELGLGIQLPITKQSDFYGDVRYEKNFGSDKRKGFKGTMGYKYTWL
ncbi:autotransporter outer membrane beta-barrel domain-containing protein, partial [Snodgrassella sp. B3800]|uniref:autotransporter outer membrane beta-barrel domain-containing protein n=1 Tax=Snodgrassella sp. B3800 TaxID=2818039 RepID=UPI002269E4C3